MKIVKVKATKEYDIVIDNGLLKKTGEYLKNITKSEKVVIITDDIVNKLYASIVESSLKENNYAFIKYVIRNGEKSKNSENYIKILNFLADNKITRSDCIIALGGGVVGDLTGFIAGTYLRGVHFVQIPTTLLSAVDSSVGGKTAINLEAGKNLAGIFYQPELVLCDYSTLETLSDKIYKDGCAEIIKYGAIADRKLFEQLKSGVKEQEESIIAQCVTIKSDIVNKDEYDTGVRQLLNFGHTFGHAVERCSNYEISHGSAVAIGMILMSRASMKMNLCREENFNELYDLIKSFDLPIKTHYNIEKLYDVMLSDKKRNGESINLVVLKEIGRCELKKVTMEQMKEFLIKSFD